MLGVVASVASDGVDVAQKINSVKINSKIVFRTGVIVNALAPRHDCKTWYDDDAAEAGPLATATEPVATPTLVAVLGAGAESGPVGTCSVVPPPSASLMPSSHTGARSRPWAECRSHELCHADARSLRETNTMDASRITHLCQRHTRVTYNTVSTAQV